MSKLFSFVVLMSDQRGRDLLGIADTTRILQLCDLVLIITLAGG